jgi:hypothetical protein
MTALTYNATIDPQQLASIEAQLQGLPRGLKQAMAMAINKTTRSARTKVTRAISSRISLTQTELRRRNIFMHLANYDRLQAELNIRGGHIPLGRFRPHPAKMSPRAQRRVAGTSVEIYRGGRETIEHAFTAQMASGHLGVFIRRGAARLPVDERRGPSIPEAVQDIDELSKNAVESEMSQDLNKNVQTLVEVLLRKAGR